MATTATEPTIEATDGTMPMATTATEPSLEATDGTMPVATTATEPTIEATNGTMPVATAVIETTGETTETTCIFDISEIISIKIKELRTNSDSIVNNISCNEPPNCFTPKSNRFAVESNSLNCNHKLTVLEGSNTKINVPDVQDVPEDNVLNNMSTNCSLLNTDSPRGKKSDNSYQEAINKPVNGVEMFILKQLEAIQKSVDSITNCKYKNTLENMLCIIKYKLIDTKPIFMATVTSMGKQNGQKRTIQHHYNNEDLLQGKSPTSLSSLKMNNKCLCKQTGTNSRANPTRVESILIMYC